MTQRLLLIISALVLASCKPVTPAGPSITLRDGWARETAPGQSSGAAYVTIINAGGEADRLISVTTRRAATAMLHGSRNEGGVVSMRILNDLMVNAQTTVALKPLATHIMLMGLTGPLKVGERLPLTLRFARAGKREVDAVVLPARSSGPPN